MSIQFDRRFLGVLFLLVMGVVSASAQPGSQTTPQTHDEYVQAGREAAKKADYKSAAGWYSKAISVRPDNYDVIYGRAGIYTVLEKYDLALKDLDTIVKALPTSIPALYLRGTVYNVKKDYKKAIQDADAILKLNPNSGQGYQVRGGAYAGQKKYKEAEEDLTAAIRLAPTDYLNYIYRGAVYEEQGMAGKSQADKLKAEQLKGGQ